MKIYPNREVLQNKIARLSELMHRAACIVLFLMMLLTIADVFLRKVFAKSILGTVEITEFMMVVIVFFGLAYTEALDGHIKVDVVMSRLGDRTQHIVSIVTQFASFILFCLVTWFTFSYSITKKAAGEVSQDLWIPVYPFVYIVGVGCGILSLVLFIKFLVSLVQMLRS